MKNITLIISVSAFLGLVLLPAAYADEKVCKNNKIHYKSCDNQIGWYIGGEIGQATTDIDGRDLNLFYQQSGLSANSIAVDDSDTAFSVFAGYQFSTHFAIEGGYIDLGERSVSFTGEDTDIASFYDDAEHIYPQSGAGPSLAVVGAWPLSESIKVSAKLGYFDWEGDYITSEKTNDVGSDSTSGGDVWFGGELNYRVNNSFQVYLSAQYFELERDKITNIALGVRYYFGDEQNIKAPVVMKRVAAKLTKSRAIKTKHVLDSDKEGVFDNLDACPDSNINHQVDEKGCVVLQEQLFDFALTVYFANDSSDIPDKYQNKIAELASLINKYEIKGLKVYGHTSAPGTRSYNQKLSEERALSISKVLVDKFNIDAQTIEPIGKGETELIDKANNETAHNVNRRIELKIAERLLLPGKK
jgi:outer membrane protein OmpA-like peptidoglycan-associated protein